MNHTHTIWNFGQLVTRARREDLLAEFVRRYGYVVQDGIFAGMVLSKRVCWGDGDLLPKLLRFYEEELHTSLSACVTDSPDLIVNLGAAEGFYPVGLARFPPLGFMHSKAPKRCTISAGRRRN
jgi:hypothetical protein